MAPTGQYLAAVLADGKGVRLIDFMSGTPLRTLHRPDRSQVISVLANPSGQRLVTIELIAVTDEMAAALETAGEIADSRGEFQINLWDPDHLDQPITLRFPTRPGPRGRPSNTNTTTTVAGRLGLPPLVAISPDGKTVAVAPSRGEGVRLFSSDDGKEFRFIQAQPDLTTLALGPDASLAAAGGGDVRIWDLDRDNRTFQTLPSGQSFTRQMRFSPKGNLLAISGQGPVELWDPVAHTLVAVLKIPEQVTDLTFAPDGQTLAVLDRSGATSLWTVIDSATRTQLGALDSTTSSLAFSTDGLLVGGGWSGNVWSWLTGRCPEVCPPPPFVTPNDVRPTTAPVRSGSGSGTPPAVTTLAGRNTAHGTGLDSTSSSSDPPRPSGQPPTERGRGGPMNRPDRPREVDRDRYTTLAFDSNGRLVAHDIRGLRIWPAGSIAAQTAPPLQYPLPPPARKGWMNLMPTAKTADGRIMVFVRSSSVFLWHADAPGKAVRINPPPRPGVEPALSAMINDPPRQSTLSADAGGLTFRAVQISPRGDRIYLIDQTPAGRLHVWALDSHSEVEPSPARQARDLNWDIPAAEGGFNNLTLSNNGAILALGDRTQTVTLLNTSNQMILDRIKPASGEAEAPWLALAFSPNGRELAVGSADATVSLWSVVDPRRPRLRFRLPGHRGGFTTSLAFDAQGRRLASAAIDPMVEVWDLELIQHELASLRLAD
jgi:WD40 repeat protein